MSHVLYPGDSFKYPIPTQAQAAQTGQSVWAVVAPGNVLYSVCNTPPNADLSLSLAPSGHSVVKGLIVSVTIGSSVRWEFTANNVAYLIGPLGSGTVATVMSMQFGVAALYCNVPEANKLRDQLNAVPGSAQYAVKIGSLTA
jgi:hypothetical protein